MDKIEDIKKHLTELLKRQNLSKLSEDGFLEIETPDEIKAVSVQDKSILEYIRYKKTGELSSTMIKGMHVLLIGDEMIHISQMHGEKNIHPHKIELSPENVRKNAESDAEKCQESKKDVYPKNKGNDFFQKPIDDQIIIKNLLESAIKMIEEYQKDYKQNVAETEIDDGGR